MFNSTINKYSAQNTPQPQSQISADVYAKVERVMSTQTKGVSKVNDALTRDQTKLSGLGQLQAALAKFQSIAQGLSGNGLATSASSSTKGILNAITGGKSVAGTYDIDVKQLAQGQTLTSGPQKAADTVIGTGAPAVIKIEFGTNDGKDFKPGEGKSQTITIKSGNNTLQGIAAAMKEAGIDASVVKGDSGYTLAINGKTGAENSMRISVTGDAAVSDLLTYSPGSAKGMTQNQKAQDALLTVNGKEVKSASNTLDKAIEGVKVELTGAGKTSLTIARDPKEIAANVGKLIDAYNELNTKMQSLQKGALKSDTALNQVTSQMQQVLRAATNGVPTSVLAKAGITFGKDGSLALDDKKLKSAIEADPEGISKLFTDNGNGVADKFAAKVAELTGDKGTLRREVTAVNKDITSLTSKKAEISKALTTQANALVKLYSQQEAAGNSGLPGFAGGGKSLFDFMA
ncbi:flagellar filament capping protein FliD [Janthinobacterium agaricidamnosum]|uniref:Flagellar hook-associated protein 2 n=1 Tax=Janthinobacterium agaricidamnosum NBRC 102515 = DSM 9628 TaxID=1349767 RepID=W0V8E8_9BURK|nr:flagellar filament capping protein FliD [Janthinobacterium agaricidamnosum]CDG83880.1 flagellar hook-associated 2 C-terminus family protein [Janthinobacterium agaricidamnosum NBRC 102515 = DSM 9628]